MKMTMHIDEALLAEVMAATGAKSKTAAVNEALRKIATKFRQRERWSTWSRHDSRGDWRGV